MLPLTYSSSTFIVISFILPILLIAESLCSNPRKLSTRLRNKVFWCISAISLKNTHQKFHSESKSRCQCYLIYLMLFNNVAINIRYISERKKNKLTCIFLSEVLTRISLDCSLRLLKNYISFCLFTGDDVQLMKRFWMLQQIWRL